MKKFNYSQYRITCPQDVNELESIIRQHGSFSKRDYERCVRQANGTDMPSRINHRLRKLIRPFIQENAVVDTPTSLVSSPVVNTIVEEKVEDSALNDIYARTYKASDFEIKQGVIILGNLRLNSVRIQACKPKWLEDITHEFTIAPEPNAVGQFHFVPYTDLSVLLGLIEEHKQAKIRLENEERKIKRQKLFVEQLPQIINQYLADDIENDYFPGMGINHRGSYNILVNAYLIQEDFSYSDYSALAKEKCHSVEFCNLEISDGEVAFKTENINLCWTLDDFYKYLWSKYNRGELECLASIISDKFEEALQQKRKEIGSTDLLRIRTHLTKDAFYTWFVKNPPLEWHKKSGMASGKAPNCFRFPVSLTSDELNDGLFLFTRIPVGCLFNLLTSEAYELPKEVENQLKLIVDTLSDDEKKMPYIQQIMKSSVELRVVQPFHFDRLGIPFSLYNPNLVLRFKENYAHYSDDIDYNYGSGYGKSTEYSYSYLLINKEKGSIVLYPENRKYAPYRFELDEDSQPIVAAYAIAAFFSSNLANKRQNFKLPSELHHFGITYFRRL